MDQLINSEAEYQAALEKLEALKLIHPAEGSEDADELDLLTFLIASYERHRDD